MAEVKKAVVAAAKPAVKTAVTTKTAEVKTAPVKETAKKEETKKVTKKAAPAKKTTAKKTTTKKAEVKSVINFQFAGKSYTTEDLMKSAQDVWKYDLGKKAAELTSIELYVKPEESQAYYVFNGEITGSFVI